MWYGAKQLLTQFAAFSLVTDKLCRLPVLFIKKTPNSLYKTIALCSLEQGLCGDPSLHTGGLASTR